MRLQAIFLLALGVVTPACVRAQTLAADLGKSLLSSGLDPAECYKVRDVEITENAAQFYLTSGYLIFGKPVAGGPVTAVFTAETDGGDAEVLLLPPNRSERKSMSRFIGSPNLDEHFSNAVFLFTEDSARRLQATVSGSDTARKAADIGALLAEQWNPVVSNLLTSFEARLALDLLNNDPGFFSAVIQGRKLGNFSVTSDPRAYEQLNAGQIVTRDNRTVWNTWTSFAANTGSPQPEDKILSYRIDATLDAALTLDCVTVMKVRVPASTRRAIPFDLSAEMVATEAKIDGVAAEVYQRSSVRAGIVGDSGAELMLVVPAQPLDPSVEHEIEIHHHGKVIVDAGHGVYFVNARGNWYPSRGLQFASYDATFHYPKNLEIVSAGEVKDDRTNGDTRITRFVPGNPIRMLGFNLGQYQRRMQQTAGLSIEVTANQEIEDALRAPAVVAASAPVMPALPQVGAGRGPRRLGPATITDLPAAPVPTQVNPAEALGHMADEIAAAMTFYSARFGPPPLTHLEVSPVPGRFGQGFPGMIYLSTLSYLPVTARPLSLLPPWQQIFYGEILRAHEAAHQWWGNVVVSGSYHNEWIMEALANYSALMFLESRKGPGFIDSVLAEYRTQMLTKDADGATMESAGPLVDGLRLNTSDHPGAWEAIAYGKGVWVFHMLRKRMGDAAFNKMLGELRRRYEYKLLDTESLRALCAEFLPAGSPDPKLENFFDEWVYGTGIPALKLTYSVKGKPGAYRLTGSVEQSGVPDDFSVTVPVEIQTGKGKVVQRVRTGSDPATFSVAVTGPVAKAILDPGQTILKR